ncbi:hypothetical protein ACFXA3_42295 [Streptomyces sp. NPDC059456]|uniref:hypothetical protein n=1 Tax=Streptomyces sp. NPDC059456 TaxID=3346838 RepID=UPI0036CC621E
MRKRLALLAVATAAVTVVTAATSASADTRIIKGAYVYFDPTRNIFGVGDTEADGRTPYLDVRVNGGPLQTFPNHNGNGTWRDVRPDETGIRDGNSLAWRARVGGGAVSDWVYEQA